MSDQLVQDQLVRILQTPLEAIKPKNIQDSKPVELRQHLLASLIPLLLLFIIELSIIIWVMYDKSIPCWDTAMHKLNSFYVYELLQHPHLRHLDWYRHIFAVSQLYPPLLYIASGSLKLILGQLANTEIVCNVIFAAILFWSLYYIAESTFKNKVAALLAAVLVFLYPVVFWSAHIASLDFGATAMVGLGLACFIWWSQNPHLSRSILLGLTFGLAALTKNNTPIFFVGPLLLDFIFALKKHNGKPDYARIRQLFIVGATAFLIILPWLLLAGSTVSRFIASIQQQNFQVVNSPSLAIVAAHHPSFIAEFFTHLYRFTLEDMALILSPLLCIPFLASFIKIRNFDKNKAYLLSSIVFAILLASAFRWPHQFRYIVPVAIPIAVLTAGLFADLWLTRNTLARIAVLTVSVIAVLQIIYQAFSPYPLSLPAWTDTVMEITQDKFKTQSTFGQMPGISINPLPESDSGIFWSLLNIESANAGKPTYLMIMPNDNLINCSPFYYLTKIRRDNIEVGSPREHTELGDKVRFTRDKAKWYQWYILKTGDQGIPFCDPESSAAYDNWSAFVRSSGLYKLLHKKKLSDGSSLELYKNATII